MATVTLYPSSLDDVNTVVKSWASNYGYSKGFTSASSSSEARANWVNGSGAETKVYWKFDLSSILDGATITNVSLTAKARRSAGNVVTSSYLVVCNGTTEVGEHSTVSSSTANTFTVDCGSGWTGASIKALSLLFYVKRNSSHVSNTYFQGFYGATLTIDYTPPGPPYTIKVKDNGSWVDATKVLVKQSGSWVEASNVLAKDNGTWQ